MTELSHEEYNELVQSVQKYPDLQTKFDKTYYDPKVHNAKGNVIIYSSTFKVLWDNDWHVLGYTIYPLTNNSSHYWLYDKVNKILNEYLDYITGLK